MTFSSMWSLISRAGDVLRQQGLKALLRKTPPFIYQKLRHYAPRDRRIRYAGVEIGEYSRVTDNILPASVTQYVPSDRESYEKLYVRAIRETVRAGDDVVLVGGGHGVSTVIAAEEVGASGSVTVFEGAVTEIPKVKQTVKLNDPSGAVRIRHGVVETNLDLRGPLEGAEYVPTANLPDCDVLCIDCDGAEFDILDALEDGPNRIVVEHHNIPGENGKKMKYDPDRLLRSLISKEYTIESVRHEPDRAYGEDEIVVVGERIRNENT